MTSVTHDSLSGAVPPVDPAPAAPTGSARGRVGLAFAVLSAASFGTSGALGRGLLDAGWSAGAAVGVRVAVAALVLLVPGLLALRGRWGLLRANAGLVVAYGLVAVAGCQLCYFYAVATMDVGVALLIEYTAPVAVVVWVWLRHGHAPTRTTLAGAAVALVGLLLVLEVLSGASLDTAGVLWALGAMVGAATYFVLNAHEHGTPESALPPMALAAGGLLVGAVALGAAGLVGLVPMRATTQDVAYAGLGDLAVPFWLPLLGLGLVAGAVAYTAGIAAGRRLGARLSSFVALGEVLAALVFAWLLLAQLPGPVQLAGGLLVLTGVVLVRLGEPDQDVTA